MAMIQGWGDGGGEGGEEGGLELGCCLMGEVLLMAELMHTLQRKDTEPLIFNSR